MPDHPAKASTRISRGPYSLLSKSMGVLPSISLWARLDLQWNLGPIRIFMLTYWDHDSTTEHNQDHWIIYTIKHQAVLKLYFIFIILLTGLKTESVQSILHKFCQNSIFETKKKAANSIKDLFLYCLAWWAVITTHSMAPAQNCGILQTLPTEINDHTRCKAVKNQELSF